MKENKDKVNDILPVPLLEKPMSKDEIDKNLVAAKDFVKRISRNRKVYKVPISNGYVMTTRPEMWDEFNKDGNNGKEM